MATISTSAEADRKQPDDQCRLMRSHAHSGCLVDGISLLRSIVNHGESDIGIASVLPPDIEIIVGSDIFSCHRFVLALCSKYFRSRLHEIDEEARSDGALGANDSRGGTTGRRAAVITLKFDDPSVGSLVRLNFDKILDFIYTGSVELNGRNAVDVYLASVRLYLDDLSVVCIAYMIATLNVENCVRYWTFAESGTPQPPAPMARVSTIRSSPPSSIDENVRDFSTVRPELDASSVVSLAHDERPGSVDLVGGTCRRPALHSELLRLSEACCLLVQTEFDRATYRPDFGDLTQSMVESILSGSKLRVKSEVGRTC